MIDISNLIYVVAMLPLAIGYVAQGPDPDWTPISSSELLEIIYSQGDEIGAQTGNYRSGGSNKAQAAFDSVTKTGPIEGDYDPEIAAFFTSEGV
jgi:hypothetical protein